MKKAAFVFATIAVPMFVQAGDFQITFDRMKGGQGNMSGSVEQKTSQKWVGEAKIENLTFKPSPEMEARYILFVKRQQLGAKAGMDEVEKVKGTVKVPPLKGREKNSFATSEVTLHQQRLEAGWVYTNGGAASASDSVSGVWIKLFKGGTEVGEYANPSSVKTKYKWE